MKTTTISPGLAGIDARRAMRRVPPQNDHQLHAWIRSMLGLRVPRRALVAGHAAPFDYLRHAFFEDRRSHRNAIVWAARGTGKTMLGAIATLLDLLFKPGIEVCILGGSFAQSSAMHAHLRRMLEDEVFSDLVEGHIAATHARLRNGSRVDVLNQSQTNIRGRRAHRLRCDEVELFDRDAWEAAQLITRSGRCGAIDVKAGVEALSTMHRPFGMMSGLVRDAALTSSRIFQWSVIDVLEACPDARRCEQCPLHDEHAGGCSGRAKLGPLRRAGFFSIEDALDQRSRVSSGAWSSEMLCREPDVTDCVYPEFSEAEHVFDDEDPPCASDASITWLGGMDFGFRAPSVLLLAMRDGANVLHVMDEIVRSGCPTPRMIEFARERCAVLGIASVGARSETGSTGVGGGPAAGGRLAWLGADPAGLQRSDQSGVSTITLWRRAGFTVRTRATTIEAGIEMVRARLSSDGMSGGAGAGLRIHCRCGHLIRALREYHYPPDRREDLQPVKDGPDHACDALRYLIANLDCRGGTASVRGY